MKTYKSKLLAMIALGGLVAFAPLVNADTAGSKSGRKATRRAAAANGQLKHIDDELQFTADQKEKCKPIFADEAQKLKALRQDTSLSKQDKAAKIKTIHEETNAKVKPLLTADQLEKWNKLREAAPKKPHKD